MTSAATLTRYRALKAGTAFRFLADGDVYVRCRGGYRPGCGGVLVRFNFPECPVWVLEVA